MDQRSTMKTGTQRPPLTNTSVSSSTRTVGEKKPTVQHRDGTIRPDDSVSLMIMTMMMMSLQGTWAGPITTAVCPSRSCVR